MDADSSDLSDVEYAGKIKTQTFRQFQIEKLIKEGKVVPTSRLAEIKEQESERIRFFEAASEDEERHRRAAKPAPKDRLESLPLVRERFEE
jgi:hypothetical protein